MRKFLLVLVLLWAALIPGFPAGAEPGTNDGAIIFVTGDGSRRDIMQVAYDQAGTPGAPRLVAGEPGVMETQPTLGFHGESAWVRRNGKVWELLKNGEVVFSASLVLSPAFRPDGGLAAAVSSDLDTSIYGLSNDGQPSLLVKGDGMAVSPAFSPDGQYLAYVGDQTGNGQIYVAEANGQNPRLLLASPVLNTDPAWSPDSRRIAFVSDETDIFVMNADGGGLTRLTQNQGVNRRPSFSPDGREIVFSSDRDGVFRLYTMKADGSDQQILLPGLNAAQHAPYWGPAL